MCCIFLPFFAKCIFCLGGFECAFETRFLALDFAFVLRKGANFADFGAGGRDGVHDDSGGHGVGRGAAAVSGAVRRLLHGGGNLLPFLDFSTQIWNFGALKVPNSNSSRKFRPEKWSNAPSAAPSCLFSCFCKTLFGGLGGRVLSF